LRIEVLQSSVAEAPSLLGYDAVFLGAYLQKSRRVKEKRNPMIRLHIPKNKDIRTSDVRTSIRL
jgi:hypothetical protein